MRRSRTATSPLVTKSAVSEAERFAHSHEDAWPRLSAIIHAKRNIGQIWDRCSPEGRAALFDYWVLDVLVVERIPETRRANLKTAVVTLRTARSALLRNRDRELVECAECTRDLFANINVRLVSQACP